VENYGTARQVTDDHMAPCAWHADNYGYNTHLNYITLFAFQQQQWLHEPASLFHCTTLPVLFSLNLYGTLKWIIMKEH